MPDIVAVIALLTAVTVVALVYRTLIRAGSSRHWPSTEGMVWESAFHVDPTPCGVFLTEFNATIRYTYEVDGTAFECDVFTEDEPLPTRDPAVARGLLNRFPVGEPCEVFYQPGNPAFAVLIPTERASGFGAAAKIVLALSLLLAVFLCAAAVLDGRPIAGIRPTTIAGLLALPPAAWLVFLAVTRSRKRIRTIGEMVEGPGVVRLAKREDKQSRHHNPSPLGGRKIRHTVLVVYDFEHEGTTYLAHRA